MIKTSGQVRLIVDAKTRCKQFSHVMVQRLLDARLTTPHPLLFASLSLFKPSHFTLFTHTNLSHRFSLSLFLPLLLQHSSALNHGPTRIRRHCSPLPHLHLLHIRSISCRRSLYHHPRGLRSNQIHHCPCYLPHHIHHSTPCLSSHQI